MKPRAVLLPSDVDRILRAALAVGEPANDARGAASPLVTRVGDVLRVADALRHALRVADAAIEELDRRGGGDVARELRRQVKQLRAGEI